MLKSIRKDILHIPYGYINFRIKHHKKAPASMTAQDAEVLLEQVYQNGLSRENPVGWQEPVGRKEIPKDNGEYGNHEEQPDLSLIVPVYNAEAYLEACLKSLIHQKTSYRYEIMCVDDGSTDASGSLLDQYAEQYDFLRVLHQENSGIAAARNRGLEASTGEYVGFIDNDDTVSEDYVQKLLDAARRNSADFIKSGYAVCLEPGGYCNNIIKPFEKIETADKAKLLQYDGYIWGGIQKRTLWSDIRFPEGYWYEDMITRFLLFRKCDIFVNLPDVIYFKREHENSASRVLWKKDDVKCLDQFFLVKELLTVSKNIGLGGADELLYRILLSELGVFLYKRTVILDTKIREAVFVASAKLVNYYQPANDEKFCLTDYERNMLQCFQEGDFKLWKLLNIQYDIAARIK